MATTIVVAGDATKLTRDRRFRCTFCDCVFDAKSTDYTLIEDLSQISELGTEASCECPTCKKTAYSYAGSSGVIPKLVDIIVLTLPKKTRYRPGETFDATGMAIGAKYDDGHIETLAAASYTTAPTTALALTNKVITVTHTASNATVEVPILVANEVIRRPYIVGGQLVYNGSAQTVQIEDYNATTMTRSGDVTKTSAGEYAVKFTPKTGYCWPGGLTGALTLNWRIAKADPAAPTLAPAAVTLDATHKSVTFAVTRSGDGAVEVKSSDETVATATVSGTTVTVKAPTTGKTGEAEIIVTVKEGTNYNAFTAGVACAVTASFDTTEG